MDLELRPSSDSGIDTIVDTEPGMRAPALNPVRLLGRADLPLSCELLTVHVRVVELLPETKNSTYMPVTDSSQGTLNFLCAL